MNPLIIEDLENDIAPAGASDAVGGPVCIAIVVIALWPREAH